MQGTVLEPCAIDANVTMRTNGPGDCAVTLSDVRMNVSADLLELAQSLQQTVIAPLVAPAADRSGSAPHSEQAGCMPQIMC